MREKLQKKIVRSHVTNASRQMKKISFRECLRENSIIKYILDEYWSFNPAWVVLANESAIMIY